MIRKIGFGLVLVGVVCMLIGVLFCFIEGLLISIAIGFALQILGFLVITSDFKASIGISVIIAVLALILGGVVNPPQDEILDQKEQQIAQLQEAVQQLETQVENDDLGELRALATQMSANAGAYWVLSVTAVLFSLLTKWIVKRLNGKTAILFGGLIGLVCATIEVLSASMPLANAGLTILMVNSLLGTTTPPTLFISMPDIIAFSIAGWGLIDALISLGMIIQGLFSE